MDPWRVDDLHALVTRAEPFRDLSREQLEGVLDMLAGRYPSDEFAELRPRIVWDRTTDEVESRNDARVLAVTSGGTIPDRGLFGVFLPGDDGSGRGGRRVGELDEEMVYERRVGETFLLGASTWRIEEIQAGPGDRHAGAGRAGQDALLEGGPAWAADRAGPRHRLLPARARADVGRRRRRPAFAPTTPSTSCAARNLVAYLADQREATGALPTDRTILVERFRDELGDWRICLLSPFGGRVHAPWAMAIEARMASARADRQASLDR